MSGTRIGAWSGLALLVGLGSAVTLGVAGPAYRAGWVDLGTALQRMLAWGAYGGLAAVALGLVAAARAWRSGAGRAGLVALLAIVLGVTSALVPWRWQQAAQAVPRIHDITTDTITPPRFVELAERRQALGVPNSLDYLDEVAAAQRAGYPDLAPAFLEAPPAEAWARALALVQARGWEVAAADEERRRIEATDTTFWFGFKDDVAIRVTALPLGGSRVDVRSVSRVGRSDIGTNARRVRAFVVDLARGSPAGR